MKHQLILLSVFVIFSSCKELLVKPANDLAVVNLFHFNIKELDSTKINKRNKQIQAAKKIIKDYDVDIISFNEVQYDLPRVPNEKYSSTGQNISKLTKLLKLNELSFTSFNQANTGNNAQKKNDGTYEINPNAKGARELADKVNFGTFPGQYSTGAASRYPVLSTQVFSNLKWKDFNPEIDLSIYSQASGESLPLDIPLFDKNFTDVVMKINDRNVHVILFHTVPSFHFGNKNSPNYVRNRDQMRFLEWYLTGNTDIEINLKQIKPLPQDTYFIAVGDWNVDLKSKDSPGRHNLESLIKKTKPWIPVEEFTFTNESSNFSPNPFRLMLDYIVVSKNIEILEGEIIHPNFAREELGCRPVDEKRKLREPKKDMKLVSYLSQDRTQICDALIHKDYYNFKIASDHYPLRAKLRIE